MKSPHKVLIFHTAFIGDIILALPLVQVLREHLPDARIGFVAIPSAAGVLQHHPAIDEIVIFDKKGRDRGIAGVMRLAARLRHGGYDLAIIPHRSIRSALVVTLGRIPRRIGFSTSTGRFLLTDRVLYRPDLHEIERNLSLLQPLGIPVSGLQLPSIFPDQSDREIVDREIRNRFGHRPLQPMIAIAPGSVWNTKRWPSEKFGELAQILVDINFHIAFVGGEEDRALCEQISLSQPREGILNAAGQLSLLQSAEIIRRSDVLVSNDSAPMHLGVAVRTPVVALFGATVPEFGFAPRGDLDRIFQTTGLSCRPCSIHGGRKCPIGTFDCMLRIEPREVVAAIQDIIRTRLEQTPAPGKEKID